MPGVGFGFGGMIVPTYGNMFGWDGYY